MRNDRAERPNDERSVRKRRDAPLDIAYKKNLPLPLSANLTTASDENTRHTTGMTARVSAAGTSLRLLALVWFSCATSQRIHAFAQPEMLSSGLIYGDNLAEDEDNLMLLSRLKQLMEEKYRVVDQEHEITDEQIEIEAALQARAAIEQQRAFHSHNPDYSAEGPEPEPETLPMPAAIVHSQMQSSGKRTKPGNSYMSLCHFKICNMGRKRQPA